MTALPKPVKVARAPRPLKRSTIKRRPRSVGKPKSRTSKRRVAQKKLKAECNKLWSDFIKRDGRCRFIGEPVGMEMHTQCEGDLQAMHGFPKKVYPGVRHAVWNGFPGCAKVHTYYTWREPEWQNWLRSLWGNETYDRRLREAILTRKYDLEVVAQTLKAAVAALWQP